MGAIDERVRTAWTRGADPEISGEEVRRRFAWARRQGRPAWLWPEVSIAAWRVALERIGAVTSQVLAGDVAEALDGDAEAIGLAGYTSGMGPLLGHWLEQGRIGASDEAARVLARHLAHNRVRSARMAAAATGVAGRLNRARIAVLVLKGAHTGPAYFPEPGARPASDIDLLVAAPDMAFAEAELMRSGFELKGRGRWESSWRHPDSSAVPRSLTYVHADDPWSVDLHGSLNISAGDGGPVADLDLGEPMAGAGCWPADPSARVLEQPLLLLHLAAHAGAGWQNLTLLRLVELVLVIRRDAAADVLDWDAFLEVGGRSAALAYAYPALRLAETLSPGTVPDAVLGACARRAPPAVRRIALGLTPATAQRVDRSSLAEHFMWAAGWRAWLRQLAGDILPGVRTWPELAGIYEERAWRLIRGRVSQ